MDLIPNSEILEFPENIVFTLRQKYNLEKPERLEEALDLLEDWIRKHNFLTQKHFDRRYLETCLISSKGSIERTKQRIEKLCVLRTMLPEYFTHSDVRIHWQEIEKVYAGWLPKMDGNNNRVYLLYNDGAPTSAETIKKLYKTTYPMCEYGRLHDYNDGFQVVLDYSNGYFTEVVTHVNFTDLKHFITIAMEGYGFRLKGLHVIVTANTVTKFIDLFLQLFRPLVSEKIFNRLHIHKNIEDVYKYVPQNIFPIEYGGKEKITLKELRDKWIETLTRKEVIDYVDDMFQARVNEAYDRKSNKNFVENLDIAGSFRKLCVD